MIPVFHTRKDNPKDFAILDRYCPQDVVVAREIHKRAAHLNRLERKYFLMDQRINSRGIGIDIPAVRAAILVFEAEKARLNKQISDLTQGYVGTCNSVKSLTEWLIEEGVTMQGLAKADVTEILERDDLSEDARKALELRRLGSKNSVAKLEKMLDLAGDDARARGLFQYHGAGTTGREAGRQIQVHNLPRPRKGVTARIIDLQLELLAATGEWDTQTMGGNIIDSLSSCLRGFLVPAAGYEYVAGDFAQIESRVIAWLAGEESKMEAYRTHGKVYEQVAAAIFHTTPDQITKDDPRRQTGKVTDLACSFGGGNRAIDTMCKAYEVPRMPEEEKTRIKNAWREAHPKTKRFWYALEDAAMMSVCNPGTSHHVGKISYQIKGSFLWCRLPSGRELCYPYPRIMSLPTPWKEDKDTLTYMSVKSEKSAAAVHEDEEVGMPEVAGNWCRIKTYGGKLAENVTQAVARDLLMAAMLAVEEAGYPIVIHVHDELVTEVPIGSFEVKRLEEMMVAATPLWAKGLPVKVEGWKGNRYRK